MAPVGRPRMNPYKPSSPRAVLAVAALAMTAMTIGLLVVLPSKMEHESQTFAMVGSRATTSEAAGVVVSQRCVEKGDTAEQPSTLEPLRGIAHKAGHAS